MSHTFLKNHIKSIHEGEKHHKYDICNFRSCRAFDMKNHIQSVHENKKNFSCEIRPRTVYFVTIDKKKDTI